MTNIPKQDFVFRKHMSIGEADAENDVDFLEECFIDNGDYEVFENTEAPQSIALGRTGVGKSALLEQIAKNNDNVIRIAPEELALKHVSNSTILTFFESLGVDLDIFYNLLWQHTLAVELIKNKFDIDSEEAQESFWEKIASVITRDKKKQLALEYIKEWGSEFWSDTEERIKDITSKLENSLSAEVEAHKPGIKLNAHAAKSLSEEIKTEISHYAKKVVNRVQIEKLSKIVNLLSEDIFNDPQQKTYILIDQLDENWVEDELRYKLIRALIETIRKFRSIKPVKIIITLRTDLLNRVLEKTRDSGFQREKYRTLFLDVSWTKEQLKSLLDRRINHLLKKKYTNGDVYFDDIFPQKIDGTSSSEYLLDRTLLRPRDAIMFVNECLIEARGKVEITASSMKLAEKSYSHERLESLTYEWFVEHPRLDKYITILNQRNYNFKVSSITEDEILVLIESLSEAQLENTDIVYEAINSYMKSAYPDSDIHLKQFKQNLLFVLYQVGVIGIKNDGPKSVKWIHDRTQDLTATQIDNTSIIYIHKILWRELAIDKRQPSK